MKPKSKIEHDNDIDNEVYQLVWSVSKRQVLPHDAFLRIVQLLDAEREKQLAPHERKLASRLLKLASAEFSNHGCNDLDLDNTDEHWDMVVKLEDEPGDRPSLDRKIVTYDWIAMDHLAEKLGR